METDVHDFWCVNKVTLFLVVSGYITECLQSCNKYNKRSKDDSIHRDFYIWYESAQADILCQQVLTLKFNASTSFLIPKAVYFYQLLSQILELEYYEFRSYFILYISLSNNLDKIYIKNVSFKFNFRQNFVKSIYSFLNDNWFYTIIYVIAYLKPNIVGLHFMHVLWCWVLCCWCFDCVALDHSLVEIYIF